VILLPIAGLSAATRPLRLPPKPLFTLALRAGEQLLSPQAYIEAVLYGGGAGDSCEPAVGPGMGALNGRFTLESLVGGGVLGRVILLILPAVEFSRKAGGPGRAGGRLDGVPALADCLANLRVALDVVSVSVPHASRCHPPAAGRHHRRRDPAAFAMINLTPGSVALDVSPDRRIMYVHVMHIERPRTRSGGSKRGSSAGSWAFACRRRREAMRPEMLVYTRRSCWFRPRFDRGSCGWCADLRCPTGWSPWI